MQMEKVFLSILVWLVLFIFGLGYNAVVAYLERHEMEKGYVSFLVAGGVLVTLLLGGIVAGWDTAVVYLVMFSASGLAMIVGSVLRHAQQQSREREYFRQMARESLNAEGENWRIPDEAGNNTGPERK